ncbi:AMP-dependent synthetase/ligase [Actinobacillus delphinicola]|uniref:Long-chain acyl-CoA synthetase n=1 Tax=Actinobacillus delphinicola TaxID=51161 RepID=A0A448TST0_9PAST|nr:long-chain fatty acid--CoA ligase [Actinobacillus delphinicola]VEJ09094.1 long-chain acyl-CoA synthetase [Actinobacillus delphinicola]
MNNLHYHIVERIRNQARTLANHPAVRYNSNGKWTDISWKDFLAQIDMLSRALLAYGINVQDKIAIFANNMPRWTIADYAAMQIRAIAVPIYGTNTAEQAAYILDNADVKILFVGNQEQYDEAIKAVQQCSQLQHIVAMKENIDLRNQPLGMSWADFVKDGYPDMQAELNARLQEKNMDDLFTLIYTSGTTGNPKGVMLTHANLAHQMEAHDLALQPLGTNDISLAFLPLSHVYERGWEAYMLHRGVVYAYLEDPHAVKEALSEVRPTLMCAVPRFYEKVYGAVMDKVHQAPVFRKAIFYWALRVGKAYFTRTSKKQHVSYLLQKQFNLADKLVLSKLRGITGGRIKIMPCGGAKLDPCVAKFFFSIGINIKAGYGLTEATATVSCGREDNFNPESIGVPMPNCEVKIGENNEILVRGGMVMKGYYKNPQATAEAFTEDGFLRTGDAGEIDAQGNLFITDRIKELMKTSTGKYIAPQVLEGKIGKDKFVDQIAIIADAKKYVSALIVPCFETLEAYAKELNIHYKNRVDLVKNTEILKLFEKRIQRLQKELPSFEQVKKFTLLPEAFTMKMNEITPTLKLKRKVILERYKKQIEAMYSSHK